MIKTFCDKCNEEITPANGDLHAEIKMGIGRHTLIVEPVTRLKIGEDYSGSRRTISNDYHICINCKLDALNTLDKREKAKI